MDAGVGLALIARDEERTLPRLLATCAGAFDEIVLVDTGSRDRTIAVFEQWGAAHPDTRCRVAHFTWIDDFGAARQFAFEQLTTPWWCWADCDDVLDGARSLRGIGLTAAPDVAGVRCRYDYAPTEHAYHVRLLRAGRGCWHGAVHEAIEISGRLIQAPGDSVRWIHRPPADGGSPKPRMRRDRTILEAQVAREPENPRARFYLAQTCRDLGDREAAIAHYERRVELDGWDEETFQAQLQAGLLLVDLDWPRAMEALIKAWELRPTRAEPLQALSAQSRVRGMYHTAHLFACRGLDMPAPPDQLFVAHWIYAWGMSFEYSITSYWIGDHRTSLRACEELLERDDLLPLHREQTLANRREAQGAIARELAAAAQRAT